MKELARECGLRHGDCRVQQADVPDAFPASVAFNHAQVDPQDAVQVKEQHRHGRTPLR